MKDYTKLHEKLAKEFSITASQVRTIRSMILGNKMETSKVIDWAIKKSDMWRKNSRRTKQHFLGIAYLLKTTRQDELNKLLRLEN